MNKATRAAVFALLSSALGALDSPNGADVQVPEFTGTVYAAFPDGQVRQLSPDGGLFVHASIDPQGRSAVFWGGHTGPPRIWLHDFEKNETVPLTNDDYGALAPSFDWQGKRVVFVADRDSDTRELDMEQLTETWRTRTYDYPDVLNLYIMNADGSGVRQLTKGPHEDRRPAFSPDGSMVVFLSDRGESPLGLYVVPADGSAEPEPILEEGWAGRPWYSADGESIYFFTDVRKVTWPDGAVTFESVSPLPGALNSREDVDRRIAHVTEAKNGTITFDVLRSGSNQE